LLWNSSKLSWSLAGESLSCNSSAGSNSSSGSNSSAGGNSTSGRVEEDKKGKKLFFSPKALL
jgi:hypothetical protein